MPAPRTQLYLKIAAVVLVVGLAVTAYELGWFHELRDPRHVADRLVQLGICGYLAFIAAYGLVQPFGIPGTVFVIAAALVWPWPIAFALSLIGTMVASVVGFSFARWIARDWVERRIPPRFRKFDDRLAARGFTTVFLLRLVFWMPPVLHAFFGVSRVRFWTHFWGSLAGYLLPLFLMSYFGQRMLDFLSRLL